jgi:dCTP deaminase
MWSDACIKQAQRRGKINITPFDELRIQPNSIDLTLDDEILVLDRECNEFEKVKLSDYDYRNLVMGEFVLASTIERLSLGNGVCAQVDGKSSYGRKGLTIHQTAGFIDAGFSGNITLEMYTVGQPIRLEAGMPICQLVFWDAYPSDKPYGSEGLGSHYQGQTGVTKSWMI